VIFQPICRVQIYLSKSFSFTSFCQIDVAYDNSTSKMIYKEEREYVKSASFIFEEIEIERCAILMVRM